MPATEITHDTPQRLELKSGSTTLTFDKDTAKARLQRKFLFWNMKPVEASLSDISQITVDTAVDRASGVEICHTMVVLRSGAGWAFPAADKRDAGANASLMREFLGLRA
jgi:hypothetical protein